MPSLVPLDVTEITLHILLHGSRRANLDRHEPLHMTLSNKNVLLVKEQGYPMDKVLFLRIYSIVSCDTLRAGEATDTLNIG